MPTSNLIAMENPDELRPFAHFEVLAAMLRPNVKDSPVRLRILDTLRIQTGHRPFQYGQLENEEIWSTTIKPGFFRGSEVGFLFNSLLEQSQSGKKPSLNQAIEAIQDQLPPASGGGKADGYSNGMTVEIHRRSPRILRKHFQQYGSVAYLWGAYVHGADMANFLRDPEKDVLPNLLGRLPLFLAYAEAHLQCYRSLPLKVSRSDSINDPWIFVIPNQLREQIVIGTSFRGP